MDSLIRCHVNPKQSKLHAKATELIVEYLNRKPNKYYTIDPFREIAFSILKTDTNLKVAKESIQKLPFEFLAENPEKFKLFQNAYISAIEAAQPIIERTYSYYPPKAKLHKAQQQKKIKIINELIKPFIIEKIKTKLKKETILSVI
jgi:hypothetical protein